MFALLLTTTDICTFLVYVRNTEFYNTSAFVTFVFFVYLILYRIVGKFGGEKFGEIGEFGEIRSHSPIKTHQIFKDSHVIYRVVPCVSPHVSTTE